MTYLTDLDSTVILRETKIVQKFVNFQMKFTKATARLCDLTLVTSSSVANVCFLATFEPGQIPVKEFFYVMALNRASRLLGILKVSEGGITATITDMRIVVKFLLDVQASYVIISHNHPSGNLRSSHSDRELTRKIEQALKLFEIELLDHLIITVDGFYSMRENGDF